MIRDANARRLRDPPTAGPTSSPLFVRWAKSQPRALQNVVGIALVVAGCLVFRQPAVALIAAGVMLFVATSKAWP